MDKISGVLREVHAALASCACRFERVDREKHFQGQWLRIPPLHQTGENTFSRAAMAARILSRNFRFALRSVSLHLEQLFLQMCSETTYVESLLKFHVSISAKSEFLKPDTKVFI